MSTRRASGSALSGKTAAPRPSARRPEQEVEPEDGPPVPDPDQYAAGGRAQGQREPQIAVQTPTVLPRSRSSGYRWRSMDSVPGSLAAAPMPITARPAIRTGPSGTMAHSTDPAQKTWSGQHDPLAAELSRSRARSACPGPRRAPPWRCRTGADLGHLGGHGRRVAGVAGEHLDRDRDALGGGQQPVDDLEPAPHPVLGAADGDWPSASGARRRAATYMSQPAVSAANAVSQRRSAEQELR